jgi:hypothetical protein
MLVFTQWPTVSHAETKYKTVSTLTSKRNANGLKIENKYKQA